MTFSSLTEIDECLDNPCDSNATCTNTDGSYICECNTGFTGNGTNCTGTSVFLCVRFEASSFLDINECEMVISPCDGNATCTDTEGSFLCVCNSGYSGNGSSCASTYVELFVHKFSVKFPDIDECSTGGVCDENAECLDTPGSYMCTCHSGYIGDGDTCLDIDECLSDPCDKNATCTNNNGSFSCQCDSGFVGNGSICSGKVHIC